MTIREQTQNQERETLSPLAVLSENTRGRKEPIEECDVRTPFQRDRDRILPWRAFRRLRDQKQVFLSPEGDQ